MKGGVAWHASPPSPDLGGDFETELGEPIARHPATISDTSSEVRLVRAEQDLTYRRLDIIGPHQRVNTDACAALALGFDIIPVIDQRGDTVPDVKALRSHGARQRVQQVGAMQQVVRKPERGRHDSGDRGTKQDPAIVPAALMPCQRPYAHACQCVGKAEPMQHARSFRADLDARAYVAVCPHAFIDAYIHACTQEGQRCGEAADATADHRYREFMGLHRKIRP
jgi:hypothetical protein